MGILNTENCKSRLIENQFIQGVDANPLIILVLEYSLYSKQSQYQIYVLTKLGNVSVTTKLINPGTIASGLQYSSPGYKAPRYPREELPENQEQNLDLGGSYQSYLYNCGECCGNCKAVCPCNPCVEYPYVQVEQSFVGVYLRFGKYIKTVQPGLIYINPCTDTIQKVDCKVQMIDCPRQQVMTKDNILVSIDATVYYRIVIPRRSIFYINDLHQAVTQLTLATIKSIAGSHTLQDLLEKRAEVQQQIEGFVDEHVWEWGIDIENMLIKDIQLNADLQNTLSMAAKEQRAAQAKVISAQGDVQSAKLMRQAAELLDSKAAMQIRYLDTITTLGQQGSTKVVLLPTDSK